jgi:predicted membrane channel-forming protein YqfA (hemolysin III family)
MNAMRILSSHFFWQFLALLMPLLVVVGKFATYRPSHDPLDISITVFAQVVTWFLHAIPAFLLARGFKAYSASTDAYGSGKSFTYLISGVVLYVVGYFFWHRFWYRSIAALF